MCEDLDINLLLWRREKGKVKCKRNVESERMCAERRGGVVTVLFLLSHCAQRSEEESETGVWDGHPAGVCSIHLPSSPLPHPSVSSLTSRHLSPPMGCSKVPLSLHLFLPWHHYTLLPLIPFCHLSVYPSFSLSPASSPTFFLCVPDGQTDNGTATRSGVRAFPYQQHARDSLNCPAYFHMTPWKLRVIYIQSIFFLRQASPFVMLLCTFSYLFFVIEMKSSHPLPPTVYRL